MVNKITLNKEELSYLSNMSDPDRKDGKEQETRSIPKSLIEKGYLQETEHGEVMILGTLGLYIDIMKNCVGIFSVLKDCKNQQEGRLEFLFAGDAILAMEYKDAVLELMLLPYLPFAIGKLANYIGTFKNDTTQLLETVPIMELEPTIKKKIKKEQITGVWRMVKVDTEKRKFEIMQAWETEEEQLLGIIKEDHVDFLRPDKENWIHQCTEWMAELHGKAIRGGR